MIRISKPDSEFGSWFVLCSLCVLEGFQSPFDYHMPNLLLRFSVLNSKYVIVQVHD